MPNWVTNRITLEGKDNKIDEFLKKHFYKDDKGETFFDFNTIHKMPEELDIENSGKARDGFKLHIAKINPLIPNLGTKEDKMLPLPTFFEKMVGLFGNDCIDNIEKYILKPSEIEELKTKYKNNFDEVVDLGEKAFKNFEKYGYTDWYYWRLNNWGTKWNAHNTFICDDKKTFYFDTAWTPSVHLIENLAKMYPDLKLKHEYAEEQTAFMCGVHSYENGERIETNDYESYTKEAYELSFDLWGAEEYYKFDERKNNYVHIDDYEEVSESEMA